MNKEKAMALEAEGYHISVTGLNLHVTEAMKQYAMEKLSKVDRFTDRVVDAHINMDIQKNDAHVLIVLKVAHTKVAASAVAPDMYAAIDMAVDKITKQVKRYISRLHDHHQKEHDQTNAHVRYLRAFAADDVAEINEMIEEENQRRVTEAFRPHKIVGEKTLAIKTLTVDEAVMKMDLSGDAFLIFRAEHDRKMHVIYRRDDGDFAIIHLEG